MSNSNKRSLDPRAALFLLIAANIIAFAQNDFMIEASWICVLAILLMLCGCVSAGIKWAVFFCALLFLQWYVLPVSPKIIATSFSIFINYSRRMLPCLIVGTLILKTIPLPLFIEGLRKLHVPQGLIIPISVTLRYFPAIREETGHIMDAMRLRDIRGLARFEALIVPLMISATETAEELSAAAVTRGIEDPAPKTSLIELRMGLLDWIFIAVSILFAVMTVVL